jgi:c-di-GMP-binding flagellar brake protein YcgR
MVFEDGRTAIKTRVVDISLGGVFLEMEKPPEAGTEIKLTPILPDLPAGQSATPITGRVVRVVEYDLENFPQSAGGVGVEFDDVSGGEQSLLASIFRQGLDELKQDDGEGDDDDAASTGEWSQVAREVVDGDPPKKR